MENIMLDETGQKLINPQTGRPYYYKDNPEAVKARVKGHMRIDGKYVSKFHPLHKAGSYKSFDDAAFSSLGRYTTAKEGDVYVIYNPAWVGWYKVGKAVDADDRCNSYNTGSPFRDYVIKHKVRVEDRNRGEKIVHSRALKECHNHSGEWFDISLSKLIKILNSLPKIEKQLKEEQDVQGTFQF
jgi:hypothetical protein